MKNILQMLMIIAACFILGACDFDSPMTTMPDGQVDQRLLGTWKDVDGVTFSVSQVGVNGYRISGNKTVYTAVESDVGDTKFIDVFDGKHHNFLNYSFENDGRTMRVNVVGPELFSTGDKNNSARLQAIIKNNIQNPKLYIQNEDLTKHFIYRRIGAPATSSVAQNNPAIKAASGRFNSDGAEIYYEIYGAKTGTPLFVLHGGPGFDHQYFLSNSAFTDLGKNRPIVFYDQRGTGKSAKVSGEQSATFDNSLTDLENLREHLGYEKIDVAGHSFGGLLAMSYAAIMPGRVAHLIIIDSVPAKYADDYSTFEKDYPQEFAEMQGKRFEALKNKDDKAMRASIVAYMKMLFYSPQKRDAFIAGSGAYSYDAVVNYTINKSADDVNVMPLIAKLTMPTLILHGRHDVNITPDSSELIHKAIPKSQFVIFEQSGHMPFYEEKDKFDLTVEKFLGGRSAEAADYDFNPTNSGLIQVTSENEVPNDCANIKNGDFAKSSKCANDALDNVKDRISVDDLIKAMNFYVINFPDGGFDILKPEDKAFLQRAAVMIQKLPSSVIIEVGAHTNNVGSRVYNLALSEDRAKAVKAALVAFGVKESVLRAKGYGDLKPKASNDTDDGRFQNRRIEYSVLSK